MPSAEPHESDVDEIVPLQKPGARYVLSIFQYERARAGLISPNAYALQLTACPGNGCSALKKFRFQMSWKFYQFHIKFKEALMRLRHR